MPVEKVKSGFNVSWARLLEPLLLAATDPVGLGCGQLCQCIENWQLLGHWFLCPLSCFSQRLYWGAEDH
jgi:hypothetical protein